MKAILNITIIFLLMISCSTSKNLKTNQGVKKVFLFAGQSNMVGRADASELSAADLERLSKVADRFEFYFNRKPVTPLQLTTHQVKDQRFQRFGPELFFGIELAEKYPDDQFIFIKRAMGETSLYGCWNPDWNSEKAAVMNELNKPKLYQDFIAYTKEVLNEYKSEEYEIAAMLWVQGESDAPVEIASNEYGKNLQNLIAKTRDTLHVPDLPFLIFQVGNEKIVEGMRQVSQSDKNTWLIPQSKDPKSADYYEKYPPPIFHYTTKSMKRIGTEFFKTYDSIISAEKTKE